MTRATRRGTAEAFAGDAVARDVVLRGLEDDIARDFPPPYRLFYYLPLEHSEHLPHQEQSIQLYHQLASEQPAGTEWIKPMLDEAQKHHDLIAQFGRFPHRNAILGRANTPAEAAYLQQHRGDYGQTPRR